MSSIKQPSTEVNLCITGYYENNYLINIINNTTKEKIYLAQKRIDELHKLINFWKINSNEKQST